VTSLGARNYKIKPSTGYAFKSMYEHAEEVADAVQNNKATTDLNKNHAHASSGRFAFYDGLLLDLLKNRPWQGKPIFVALFKRVETGKILKFLDEKTSLQEDISIFIKLPWRPFLSALMRKTLRQPSFRPVALLLITLLLLLLGHETTAQTAVAYPLFLGGLLLVGIPHGAVDHLIDTGNWNLRQAPIFVLKYLLVAAMMGVFWYFFPAFALLTFLVYSAWHFGQADGKQWQLNPYLALLWGGSVLYTLLGTHAEETNKILNSMGQLELHLPYAFLPMFPWLLLAIYKKQNSWIITIIWLLLSIKLPLLFAFGLYFVGQHSLNGWFHLKSHLKMSHKKIWLNALPFHAAAWFMLGLFFLFWPASANEQEMGRWGIFFIFIACISLPHVVVMQSVYSRKSKRHSA
jgi:Brp/Blh family beta-carotene 15,15'-monooxygenase